MTSNGDKVGLFGQIVRMKEAALEREANQVIQLPLWPEPKRGTPNSFIRSALFAAIQSKDRVFLHSARSCIV